MRRSALARGARIAFGLASAALACAACGRLPDAAESATGAGADARARWQAYERCEESRERLERCPRGTGARKRRRDDCTMSDRIARMHDPGYPRCIEPDVPRPP